MSLYLPVLVPPPPVCRARRSPPDRRRNYCLTAFSHLKHRPYIDSLPPPTELVTPLHFTPAELALLNGTNLLGATLDRRKEWENEWREVRDIFADAIISWGEGLTWCVPACCC